MTQNRGLGRGLGALIPGGSPQPAPAEEGLRTRSHPRTAPEPGEPGASVRPVDMFFSGDPVEPAADAREDAREGAAGRSRPARTDIASDMARSVRERRAAGKAPAAKAPAAKAPAAKSQAVKAAAEKKAPAAKTSAAKSSAVTSDAGTSDAGTAPTASAPLEQAAPAAEIAAARENSPVVDVGPAERFPAREEPTRDPESRESAQDAAQVPEEATQDGAALGTAAAAPAPEEAADEAADDAPAAASSTELLPVPGAEFAEIPIQEIRENPRNPRTMFNDEELDELAFSLREVGVLQPVVVRPIPATDAGESFELVMGERRWRAARRAGLASIPAIIRETSDDDLLRDALLENLHRSQLNPLEEAAAYQQLLEDFGCTQDELAERIGRSRPQISNTLRLMRLPALLQRRLASGAISAGHARALLTVDDSRLQEELAQRIVAEGLSVRAVERLVSRGMEPAGTRPAPRRTTYNPRVVDLTSRLANQLETPVKIDLGKRKGRITLEFTNLEDLERLIGRLGIEEGAEGSAQE